MMISRTNMARLLVNQPGQRHHIRQIAAWLVATGQTRRTTELMGEVARLRAEQGHLWVKVTTAQPLTKASKKQVERFIKAATNAHTLEMEATVAPDVIGGVLIETAGQELDATVAAKLKRFVREASV
jgi:F0F1-type ATP synthase delta subunit